MSEKKTKKQHFVPQTYLEHWAIPNTHQIYVYDKLKKEKRINNINDIASENYFYDVDYNEALSQDGVNIDPSNKEILSKLSNDQHIEKFFAQKVENELSCILRKIISKAEGITDQNIDKIHFISQGNKKKFSYQLMMQHLRTKATRNSINNMSNCLLQILADMNVSKEQRDKFKTSRNSVKYIHENIFTNKNEIKKIIKRYKSFIWILGINKTRSPFFTTDNPITNRPHKFNEYISMSGLMSEGIEVFFPLSPELILIMFDNQYHSSLKKYNRKCYYMNSTEVRSYNAQSCLFSERFIYSINDDFSVINDILDIDKNIFNAPKISVNWNGKTYTPNSLNN